MFEQQDVNAFLIELSTAFSFCRILVNFVMLCAEQLLRFEHFDVKKESTFTMQKRKPL